MSKAGRGSPVVRIKATGRSETFIQLARQIVAEIPHTARVGWSLALRQTQGEMRGNQLGVLWLVLSPLLYAAAYLGLRAGLEETMPEASKLPGGVFAITGIVIFQSWFEALTGQFTVLQRNAALLRSIGIKPEILFLSGLASAVFVAVPRLSIAIGAAAITGGVAGPGAVLGFAAAGMAAIFMGGALGFALAPLGILVEDLRRAVQSLSLLLLVGSGAFFPPSILDGTPFRDLLPLVPPAGFVDIGRSALLGGSFELATACLSWTIAGVVISLSAAVFLRLSIRILAERFR